MVKIDVDAFPFDFSPEEIERLKTTEITVTRANAERVLEAETEELEYFFLQDSYLNLKAEGLIYLPTFWGEAHPDALKNQVRKFLDDKQLIDRWLSKMQRYNRNQEFKRELAQFAASGLSPEGVRQKARDFDNVNNEGGEGFNPYRPSGE